MTHIYPAPPVHMCSSSSDKRVHGIDILHKYTPNLAMAASDQKSAGEALARSSARRARGVAPEGVGAGEVDARRADGEWFRERRRAWGSFARMSR